MSEKYTYENIISGLSKNWLKIIDKEDLSEIATLLDTYSIVNKILPTPRNILATLKFCEPKDVKVVIIGQDCYLRESQAMGLAFSVPENIKPPPSLRNIFRALSNTLGINKKNPNLTKWNKQGVLLLNAALTVVEKRSRSHMKIWESFTDSLIEKISLLPQKIIFVLWGKFAQKKCDIINDYTTDIRDFICNLNKNLVLKYIHPSPLAKKFGEFALCPHFKIINECMEKMEEKKIDWKD